MCAGLPIARVMRLSSASPYGGCVAGNGLVEFAGIKERMNVMFNRMGI
jgi:hypothetical protein